MTREEAGQVVAYLTAGFHREALEQEAVAVWVSDVALLPDAGIAAKAAHVCVRGADRFPTIHQFRKTYRSIAESERISRPALDPSPRENRRPQWVDVWAWARQEGEERWFPQQRDHGDRTRGQIDQTEYEQIAQRWEDAGRPRVGYPEIARSF